MWLVHHGVPFDVAFNLDDATRVGWSGIFAEFGGAKFNVDRMEFETGD